MVKWLLRIFGPSDWRANPGYGAPLGRTTRPGAPAGPTIRKLTRRWPS